ncbi:MAG: glycosyltransferase family 2 protein [Clostridiales bacterium]|nr:glycosyltransferase family 2 protein [Candidatus Cacconaster stercorequi]
MPTVSVIMPAYNAARYIETAITSVLRQTYTDWELIVVDDCATDGTADIIHRLAAQDTRIVFLRNAVNRGVSYTRNYAISQARGQWIAFLDSDDLWREDKLEKQLALTQKHPDGVLFFTASGFITFDDQPLRYVMPAPEQVTYRDLLRRNLLSCSSVLVKREVMAQVKMARDDMHEDYSAWLTILRQYPCAYGVNEPLLIYRFSPGSKSANRLKSAKMLYRSYRYVGYHVLSAAYMTCRYTVHSVSKRYKIAATK